MSKDKNAGNDLEAQVKAVAEGTNTALDKMDKQNTESAEKVAQVAKDIKDVARSVDEIKDSIAATVIEAMKGYTGEFKGKRSEEQDLGNPGHLDASIDMDGDVQLATAGEAYVNSAEFADKAAMLRFMDEMVEVIVHTSSDTNADPVLEIGVNGKTCFFQRGQKTTCKRKFIEGLARAKPVSYSQRAGVDNNGAKTYYDIASNGSRYGFQVLKDSPQGEAWLLKVLAEA